jgi:hypothetical protein
MDPEDLKETLLQNPSVEEPQEERKPIVLFFWFGWSIAFSCELYAVKLTMDTCAYIGGQELVCEYNPKVDIWVFVGYIIMLFVIVIVCIQK